jgi:hypothetical protein
MLKGLLPLDWMNRFIWGKGKVLSRTGDAPDIISSWLAVRELMLEAERAS